MTTLLEAAPTATRIRRVRARHAPARCDRDDLGRLLLLVQGCADRSSMAAHG